MSELKTLSQSSPDFESYLLGTFSSDKRALPLHTLNVNSASETVTFEIVPVRDIKLPSLPVRILHTLKVKSFLLVLVPLFLTLTKNIEDQTIRDSWTTFFATIGVILAFVSVNLRNDFMDHMKGVDRIIAQSGSQAIQKGWMTAAQVKFLSTVFLVLSLLCAVPVIFAIPQVLLVMVVAGGVGVWAQFQKRNSFKYQIGGELFLFLMLGPLLTAGYQLAMGASLDSEILWLGALWGWLAVFVVHLRNFRNILVTGQAGFTNTVNWLGFDRSRRLLAFWWVGFILFNLIYHLNFMGYYWGWYLTVILLFVSSNFIYRVQQASSPVGSEIVMVFQSGYNLFLITIGLWVFECLWYLIS